MKYSNYQLASQRWVGSSWALLGDAGGFIDPIFSSGLLLALEGAAELAHAINNGWDRNAQRYEKTMARKLAAWRSLIESFYDGRMFSLFRLKRIYADSKLFRYPSDLVDRQLALALSGVAPASTRRLWLLSFLLRYLNGSSKRYRLKIA
jgi:flavin-dependent dehydrogenase